MKIESGRGGVALEGSTPRVGTVTAEPRATRTAPDAHLPDLDKAPPSFGIRGGRVVFPDIQHVHAKLVFDVTTRTASLESEVRFDLRESGYPALDLVSQPSALEVDGKKLAPSRHRDTEDPDHAATFRVLHKKLEPGAHVVTLRAPLEAPGDLAFGDGGVEFTFRMRDLQLRHYLEQYLPSGFLYDQYSTDLDIEIRGGAGRERVMTNGELTTHADGTRSIRFPAYFNPSSYFLHILDPEKYSFVEDTYAGLERPIPITVYSETPEAASEAMTRAKALLEELERDYGPYPHERLLIHLQANEKGGGMEYSGATRTAMSALSHEVFHSWFARSVMPASGNAGFLDEALARWRDRGYPRAESVDVDKARPALASFSRWRRQTTRDAYAAGADVMAELDRIFAPQGGLRPVLREFFAAHRNETVTVEMFDAFLQARAEVDLRPYLARVLYAGPEAADAPTRGAPVRPVDDPRLAVLARGRKPQIT